MRKSFITLLSIIALNTYAQNTFPTNGYVGIGTTSPNAALEVVNELRVRLAGNNIDKNLVRIVPLGYSGITGAMNWSIRGAYQYSSGINTNSVGGDLDIIKAWNRNTILATKTDGTPLGNVGIGTLSPQSPLHIYQSGPSGLRFERGGHDRYELKVAGSKGLFITNLTDVREEMTFAGNGRIGIGTTSPASTLDVRTSSGKSVWLNFNDESAVTFFPNNGNSVFHLSHGHDNKLYLSQGGSVGAAKIMTFVNNGNVGIGTTDPSSWKLAVNGKIRAKEIKVETGWSDFVFEKEYNLPTLEEVEEYIKENGHLRDIPSAEEVTKNGIFLGEMDSKLLQKIEELTLYTISQEKRIKRVNKKLEEMKKENDQLKQLLQRIQTLEEKMNDLKSKK